MPLEPSTATIVLTVFGHYMLMEKYMVIESQSVTA